MTITRPRDRATRWVPPVGSVLGAPPPGVSGNLRRHPGSGCSIRDQLARIDEVYYDRQAAVGRQRPTTAAACPGGSRLAINRHSRAPAGSSSPVPAAVAKYSRSPRPGYEVIGFEPHEELVRFGNELLHLDGTDARIQVSDRDGWPADAGEADGVVVGWGGYMLLSGRDRRIAFLRDAARLLPTGAPLLVSFFATDHQDLRLRTTARVACAIRRLLGREPVAVGDALAPNLVHFFTREDIAGELADGGFDLIDFGTTDYGWAVGRARPDEEGDLR